MSVSRLSSKNVVFVQFDSLNCLVKDKVSGRTLLQGRIEDGLCKMTPPPHASHFISSSSLDNNTSYYFSSSCDTWHRRLGNPSCQTLSKILKLCNVKRKESNRATFCEACQYGKSHILPFKSSDSHASFPLDLVHTNLWGPSPVASLNGFHYYIHFVDDNTRYTWIYPLKTKDEALAFIQFKKMVENQLERTIQML